MGKYTTNILTNKIPEGQDYFLLFTDFLQLIVIAIYKVCLEKVQHIMRMFCALM